MKDDKIVGRQILLFRVKYSRKNGAKVRAKGEQIYNGKTRNDRKNQTVTNE